MNPEMLHSVLFFVCFFLAGLYTGISGGGAGMLIATFGSLFLDLRESIVLAGFVGITAQMTTAVRLRRFVVWPMVAKYALPGIIGGALGGMLLFAIPAHFARILLGLSCIAFVLLRTRTKRSPPFLRKTGILMTLGFCNGFLAGLTRGGVLVRSSVLLALDFSGNAFLATSAAMACVQSTGQSSVYLYHFAQTNRTPFLLLALIVAATPLGTITGHACTQRISKKAFERMQVILLVVGSLYLLFF